MPIRESGRAEGAGEAGFVVGTLVPEAKTALTTNSKVSGIRPKSLCWMSQMGDVELVTSAIP
ncbi:hypothetical protein [Coleofasciculus chthonoplastes]|uniref:hypothetical protein n=1 Tax=Coleofasciculus chthonoplastes TaxID=64178 RepID=UPI0002F26B7B|nr:hypothetical protein [Coleofasciculus chthonoplastes]